MSRKLDQRESRPTSPESGKAYPWRFPEQLSDALRNYSAPMKSVTLLSKLYDLGIPPSPGEHPPAQTYRVEISNFRINRVLQLQHNAAQLYS